MIDHNGRQPWEEPVDISLAVEAEIRYALKLTRDRAAAADLLHVSRAFTKLTEGQRKAVLLIGLGGWAYERAAKASGVPVGTVRSRRSRGREKRRGAA
jgi:RNA polymerase sigma-70 factor (ECF subfamily)